MRRLLVMTAAVFGVSLMVGLASLLTLALPFPAVAQRAEGGHWVATWAAPLVARPERPQRPGAPPSTERRTVGFRLIPVLNNDTRLNDQTTRQIVRTSTGGEQIRIVVSNVFGTHPLEIGSAAVALRADGPVVIPSTIRFLTFSGHALTRVLPGAVVISDPVVLTVPPLSDLVIDLYLPGDTMATMSPVSWHNRTEQTNYVSTQGDHVGEVELAVLAKTESWFYLARVDVIALDHGRLLFVGQCQQRVARLPGRPLAG